MSLLSPHTFISSVRLSGWWESTVNAGTQVLDGRYHPQTGFLFLDNMKLRGSKDLEPGKQSMMD